MDIVFSRGIDIKGHIVPVRKQSLDMYLVSYLGYSLGIHGKLELDKAYELCISKLAPIINDIYYTKMSDGRDGIADVIIASNVYTCPSCGKEIVLYKHETGKRSEYKCPECGEIINITQQAIKELQIDKRGPVWSQSLL